MEVEMKIRCVPSVWLSVTPHLENPGYAFVTVSKLNIIIKGPCLKSGTEWKAEK